MTSTGTGFRVLELGHQIPADPKIVAYRLDATTLDFVEVSGSAERLLGFPPDDWCRPGFWSGRIHPEDREAARAFFAGWTGARRDGALEYRVVGAAGQTVWVHQVIEVVNDPRGEPAIRGFLRDITERVAREAEVTNALALRDELFRILAEELAPPVRAISIYGDMLERHLATQQDDVGSDYALGLRDGVQRLDEMLAQLMRATQNGNMSVEEMKASLAALGSGRRAG